MIRQRVRWFHWLVALACLLPLFADVRATAAASAGERAVGAMSVLYADDRDVRTYVAPPPRSTQLQIQAATITVEYEGFPPEAQAAVQYAVEIWQSLLVAPLPIRIHAVWAPLPRGVLGGTSPQFYRTSSTNPWYPAALAKQLMNRDPQPGEPDIEIRFNSSGVNWYLGTGQAPTGQYNLATVALHEFGHGLGITDSFSVNSDRGGWGLRGTPFIFDRFVTDASGTSLLDTARYPNPSNELAAGLQNNQLFFNGARVLAANSGNPARLYAPNPFQDGSSVSHLDEKTYPPGNPNSLMTPQGARGETNYNPGPIALGILADLGWTVTDAPIPSPAPSGSSERCFPQTGQCISGSFLAYWDAHGGLPINGYPLTAPRNEILEDGNRYLVQWFERVRMEYHPENVAPNDVQLGQFGRRIHPADPPVAQKAGYQYFTATGHNMAPDLLAFWQANGGLAQFGYPLTEEFQEKLEDGKTYTVQYTERARLERHPENAPPNQIQLGQFGRRLLGQGTIPAPIAAARGQGIASTASTLPIVALPQRTFSKTPRVSPALIPASARRLVFLRQQARQLRVASVAA